MVSWARRIVSLRAPSPPLVWERELPSGLSHQGVDGIQSRGHPRGRTGPQMRLHPTKGVAQGKVGGFSELRGWPGGRKRGSALQGKRSRLCPARLPAPAHMPCAQDVGAQAVSDGPPSFTPPGLCGCRAPSCRVPFLCSPLPLAPEDPPLCRCGPAAACVWHGPGVACPHIQPQGHDIRIFRARPAPPWPGSPGLAQLPPQDTRPPVGRAPLLSQRSRLPAASDCHTWAPRPVLPHKGPSGP